MPKDGSIYEAGTQDTDIGEDSKLAGNDCTSRVLQKTASLTNATMEVSRGRLEIQEKMLFLSLASTNEGSMCRLCTECLGKFDNG